MYNIVRCSLVVTITKQEIYEQERRAMLMSTHSPRHKTFIRQ